MRRILLLLAGAIFGLHCSAHAASALLVGVATDKTVYKPQEPVALVLTVTNPGAAPFRVNFASGKRYDFTLLYGEEAVWKWSEGRMFSMSLASATVEPGKPLTFTAVFHQTLSSGRKIKPGRYRVVGSFVTMEREWTAPPVEIEIRR
jgi:hypothetical protein